MGILKWIIIFTSVALAIYYDSTQHKIRNFVTLPAAASGCLINFINHGYSGLFDSLKGWFAPVMLLFVFYSINLMGAGDIKFFGALGAIMGQRFVITSMVLSIFFGAVIAIILLFKRRFVKQGIGRILLYVWSCLVQKKILLFPQHNEGVSRFPFSYAVLPSVIVQFMLIN